MNYDFTVAGNSPEVEVDGDAVLGYHIDFTTGTGVGSFQWEAKMEDTWVPVADAISAHMDVAAVLDCPSGRRVWYRLNGSGYTSGTITVVTT